MATNLSRFLRQQLDLQQLTEREFAARSGLGLSHVYQILRGERKHTRGDTLDKVAIGLHMTPAEMANAMGRGSLLDDLDPEIAALVRQVQIEDQPTLKSMLRGLVSPRNGHVTDSPEDFGKHNCQPRLQARPIRPSDIRRAESRSMASLIAQFGLQPSY
jgi:transcriptional regulator with XRE-family HTH domain